MPNIEAFNNKIFLVTINNNISSTYRELNQPTKALPYAKRALQLTISNDDTTGMGHTYQYMGNCYDGLQQFDSSIAAYKKAEKINEQLHDDYFNGRMDISSAKGTTINIEFQNANFA